MDSQNGFEDRLFVAVLGHRNAGKSSTWNSLFGRTVRTGNQARHLELKPNECVEVFLLSGSPEERELYAGDIITDKKCRIVLCSIQYIEHVNATIGYARENGFQIFVQWLNPGYSDQNAYWDRLGLANQLLSTRCALSVRDGKQPLQARIQELREVIYGWATYRGLIFPCHS